MTNEKLLLRYVKAHYRSIKKSKYTFLIPYIFVLLGFGWIGLYFLNNSDYIRQFFLIPILSSFLQQESILNE
jgi:hypothetical protein